MGENLFAPPSKEEMGDPLFAPPSPQEVASPQAASAAAPEKSSISPEEIQSIAKKHGANPEYLQAWVPLLGVDVTGEEKTGASIVRRGIGIASEALFGLPNWVAKKIEDKPTRAALDELSSIAQERKSGLTTAAEIAVGIALPGGPVARSISAIEKAGKIGKIGAGIAHGVAGGAIYGVSHSKEDEELAEAAKGAGYGAVFGAALGATGALFSRGVENFRTKGDALREATEQSLTQMKSLPIYKETAEYVKGITSARQFIPAEVSSETVQAMVGKVPIPTSFLSRFRKGAAGEEEAVFRATEDLLKTRMEKDAREFVSFVTGKKAPEGEAALSARFNEMATQGPEFIGRQWERFSKVRAAETAVLQDKNLKSLVKKNWAERALLFIVDGRNGAARWIDNNLGTDLEQLMDQGSQRIRAYVDTVASKVMSDEASTILEETRKLAPTEMSRLYDSLDTGTKLDGRLGELADWYRNRFSENWQELKNVWGMELGVGREGKYVPHRMIGATDVAGKFRAWAGEAGGLNAYRQSISPEQLAALEFVSGLKIGEDASKFQRAFDIATNPQLIGERATTRARFLFAREGQIPELLRERNVADLFTNWVSDTYKHVHMRDIVAELKSASKLAGSFNNTEAADYLIDLAKDMAGVRRGTASSWFKNGRMQWQTNFLKKAEEAESKGNTRAASFHKFLAAMPEFGSMLNSSMYNSFLSMSPRSALQNMTQPLLMTVPELGWKYGSQKLLTAYRDMANILGAAEKGMTIRLSDEAIAARFGKKVGEEVPASEFRTMLSQTGRSTQRFNQEMAREHAQHLQQYATYRMAERAINKWNDVSMSLFEGAEKLNRNTTALMALGVTRDLLGKSSAKEMEAAQRFVKNMGSSYSRSIQEALAKNDGAKVLELMTNYLVGKTMFNYNTLTKSGYGRYMGPMLSVFTKWPSSIAGDILVEMQRRGIAGGMQETARRYFAPIALLYGVNAALGDELEQSGIGEAVKPFTGKQGLVGMTPLAAVKPLVTGEMSAPPAVAVPRDIGVGLATADLYKIYRGINNLGEAFMPVLPALTKTFVGLSSFLEGNEAPRGTLFNKLSETLDLGNPDTEMRDLSKQIRESLGM